MRIACKPTDLSTLKPRRFYLIEEGRLGGEILLCIDLNWSGSSVYCLCVKREKRGKREKGENERELMAYLLSDFSLAHFTSKCWSFMASGHKKTSLRVRARVVRVGNILRLKVSVIDLFRNSGFLKIFLVYAFLTTHEYVVFIY